MYVRLESSYVDSNTLSIVCADREDYPGWEAEEEEELEGRALDPPSRC
jgi:hypothetical protein